MVPFVVCRRAVVNFSVDLAARAIVLQAFLFDKAKIGAAKELTLKGQINRAKSAGILNFWQDWV